MANLLTERFIEKVKKEKPNLKELSSKLGIPYDRMYSWIRRKGNPKPPDDNIIENWVNGRNSNADGNNTIKNKTSHMEQNVHTEKLIEKLEDMIDVLKNNNARLEEHNQALRGEVKANLKTVLDNQLTLTVLFESYLKSFASLMIQEPSKQQEFRLLLHKDAFVRLSALKKTGIHIDIDNDDIISHNS